MNEDIVKDAATVNLANKKERNIILLRTLSAGQESMGECPWCEVPIGAYSQHYNHSCPYTVMAAMLDNKED